MREHGRAVVKEERSYGDGVRDAGMVFGFVASLVVERTAAGDAVIRWEPGRRCRLRIEAQPRLPAVTLSHRVPIHDARSAPRLPPEASRGVPENDEDIAQPSRIVPWRPATGKSRTPLPYLLPIFGLQDSDPSRFRRST